MTTVTIQQVNAVGRKEIHDFLANHVKGREHFDEDMLHAWAADADFSLSEGNRATIEITGSASIHGRTETFTISDAGLDSHDVEIDE